MKQKIYYLGIISAIVVISGTMFKIEHWAGAGILLGLGTFLLLVVFLPAALLNHYKANGNRQNRLLYIITYVTSVVVFISMLFRIQHWPYAGYFVFVAVPFPFVVFLPVWLYVTSKIKSFDINNTIFVLFLLALQSVFSVLLALNVSKEKIDNSLQLTTQLSSFNSKIEKLRDDTEKSAVIRSADDLLLQIEECRQILFKRTGITREGLNNRSTGARYFDSPNIAPSLLRLPAEASPAMKLESLLRIFIAELEKLPASGSITNMAIDIFDLTDVPNKDFNWTSELFIGKPLAWTLVDLDAMENYVRVVQQEFLN